MTGLIRSAAKKALGVHTPNSDDDQKRLVSDAKTIFDVGANVGQTARTYRHLYPEAAIWSFEPSGDPYAELTRCLGRDERFHPVRAALSDTVGSSVLNLGPGSVTNSLLQRNGHSGAIEEIAIDTIDRFCAEAKISQIDILKVDAEGAEMKVFAGAAGMFRARAIRAVFVEVYFHPVYEGMGLMWDIHTHLASYGFRLFNLYSLNAGSDGYLSFANALYIPTSLNGLTS